MNRNSLVSVSFGILAILMSSPAWSQGTGTLREFTTRPGVSVKSLVASPAKPIGQVILLPGGLGDIGLDGAGKITAPQMADNFTVRTRDMYVAGGFSTILLDTALDIRNLAYSRESIQQNAADIRAVAAALKKESDLPLWLVGTSLSSWRLALLTPRMQSEVGIAGIVLTATVTATPELLLSRVAQISVPVMVVHHREDACQYSKADTLPPLIDAIKTPIKKVVWIEGGNSKGDPCHEWAYHGFNGKETEAVGAIIGWMKQPG